MKTGKITGLALLISVAMILSYIESQIPPFVAVPGVKAGLANIAVVFALYKFGAKEAAVVSLVRVTAVSMLFGSPVGWLYSAAGAALSLCGMMILKKTKRFTQVSVSVAGGVLHNAGQIAVACVMLETNVLKYYLPFLIFSGVIAGIVVGVIAAVMVRRINIRL